MQDLTILFITASRMPPRWVEFQTGHLLKAASGSRIISISRRPMDLGTNLIDDGAELSYWNIYRQMLRGALLADTPYVAMAEDDVLYTPEHFCEFRPPPDRVAYDRSRWSLFTWERRPMYCLRQRVSNCSLIAPRDLLIEALEERERKWPDGAPNAITGEVGRAKVERWLGVTPRASVEWYCTNPIVQINHDYGCDDAQRRRWKKHGQIKAWDIPYWGRASDIVRIYASRDA